METRLEDRNEADANLNEENTGDAGGVDVHGEDELNVDVDDRGDVVAGADGVLDAV